MGESKGWSAGGEEADLIERFAPQFILLILPTLCASIIIISGESLIVSDIAFMFGAILIAEIVYFSSWALNSEIGSEKDLIKQSSDREKAFEIHLECPECQRRFYNQIDQESIKSKSEIFECSHCQHRAGVDLHSILEN